MLSPSITQVRYKICPQMETYDALPQVFAPYMAFTSQPNFRSPVVNTDEHGFRRSYDRSEVLTYEQWRESSVPGLVLGSSFIFGVGATRDQHTLVSALTSLTNYKFLNLGIRAGNSFQELIASIPFLSRAKCLVVCSGMNNMVVHLQSIGRNELYGPLFAEECFKALERFSMTEVVNLVERSLSQVGFGVFLKEFSKRLQRKIRRTPAPLSHAAPAARLDWGPACEKAIAMQIRDLFALKRILPADARLIFCLQPFASVCKKMLSTEETALFTATDQQPHAHWQILKTTLLELWPVFTRRLKEACDKETIRFVDLNEINFEGWSFVDRAHMTDDGYRQAATKIARSLS